MDPNSWSKTLYNNDIFNNIQCKWEYVNALSFFLNVKICYKKFGKTFRFPRC